MTQHSVQRRPSFLSSFFSPEIRAWNGTAPLSEVFWLHGVLTSTVQIALYAWFRLHAELVLEQLLLVGFAAYSLWIVPSLWRCSFAVESFWNVLARWLTVAWAANAAFVLVFLQFDLLLRFAGR